jgi:hypothetical protein
MNQKIDPTLWKKLWAGIQELSTEFDRRIVFIGGIAVYLHVESAIEDVPENFIEYSHDGDFYISREDFIQLTDLEEVVRNQRLQKHQITKSDIDFDVYKESQNNLLLKYTDVAEESVVLKDVRVACLEHLLLLKLDAYRDRRNSAKGHKDERDLIRIVYLLGSNTPKNIFEKYLLKDEIRILSAIQKSSEFITLCSGNTHLASKLRDRYTKSLSKLSKILGK